MTDPNAPSDQGKGPADSYRTLMEPAEYESKVQRSRFIALAVPAVDPTETKAILADVRKRFHDARHVCYAWRLGPEAPYQEKRNDDGEPGGTAGEPILNAIDRAGLTCILVAVVRYFGGIKLGTGGLGRAYGQAADGALAAGKVRVVEQGKEFHLTFPYAHQKTLTRMIQQHGGRILRQAYGEAVSWVIWLPHSTCRRFGAEVREATAGTVSLKQSG